MPLSIGPQANQGLNGSYRFIDGARRPARRGRTSAVAGAGNEEASRIELLPGETTATNTTGRKYIGLFKGIINFMRNLTQVCQEVMVIQESCASPQSEPVTAAAPTR
ncbi:hypothetical protein EVAR_36598_1 [Eumeta japonica]|uniref:Uncharacterized protein n=1 Tax=Eumeta variegata TaxID=151549 RepID=A0A4C1XS13_EUMVA|nr:hypothetical protein EVAR_36598_1 [Eumeta japonica]